MDGKAGTLSRSQKNTIRAITFVITFIALVIIPFGVIYGRFGKGWMLLSNVLFCFGLTVIAVGATCWVVMRFRSLVRK